jgi:hypothetical protein
MVSETYDENERKAFEIITLLRANDQKIYDLLDGKFEFDRSYQLEKIRLQREANSLIDSEGKQVLKNETLREGYVYEKLDEAKFNISEKAVTMGLEKFNREAKLLEMEFDLRKIKMKNNRDIPKIDKVEKTEELGGN